MFTVIVGIAILVLWLTPPVMCGLKGKPVCAAIGVLFVGSIWAWVGMVRFAKPDSWWARNNYGPDLLARAHERFSPPPPTANLVAERNQELRDAWEDEDINPDDLDRTTRRALRRAGRL